MPRKIQPPNKFYEQIWANLGKFG